MCAGGIVHVNFWVRACVRACVRVLRQMRNRFGSVANPPTGGELKDEQKRRIALLLSVGALRIMAKNHCGTCFQQYARAQDVGQIFRSCHANELLNLSESRASIHVERMTHPSNTLFKPGRKTKSLHTHNSAASPRRQYPSCLLGVGEDRPREQLLRPESEAIHSNTNNFWTFTNRHMYRPIEKRKRDYYRQHDRECKS
jgi:hypothetical protein